MFETKSSRTESCGLLNLDRRPDRLESFLKSAKRAQLRDVERISAVDGTLLNVESGSLPLAHGADSPISHTVKDFPFLKPKKSKLSKIQNYKK